MTEPEVLSRGEMATLSVDALSAFEDLRVSNYILAAAVALLVYDYVLTIRDEIIFMWNRRLGLCSCFFYFNRYLPFIEAALFMTTGFARNPTSSECGTMYSVTAWLYLVGVFTASGTLIFRTYAIWDSSKRIAWMLTVLILCFGAVGGHFVAITAASVGFSSTPSPSALSGCLFTQGKNLNWVCYLLLVIFETVILVLTLWKITQRVTQNTAPLYQVILRDGLTFYILLLMASMVNIIFFKVARESLKFSFAPVHRVLHAILSGRLLLNMRSTLIDGRVWYYLEEESETESSSSSFFEY